MKHGLPTRVIGVVLCVYLVCLMTIGSASSGLGRPVVGKAGAGAFTRASMAPPTFRSAVAQAYCEEVVDPTENSRFETMSYMAEFGEADQEAQINYMIKNGLIPCVEFDSKGDMYRENSRMPGYYDGRYWSMWKLPMFGATDARSVMAEVRECQRYNPNAYIRILGFDNVKQVQCMGFLVGKPQGYRSSQAATPSYGSSQSSHGASSESSGSSESSYGSAYQSSVSNWQQQAQHQAQHQTQHQTQHQAHQPTQQQSYDYQHGAGTQPASQSKSQWSFDSYGPGSGSESMSRASFESKASGYKSLVGGSSQEELNGINQRISLLEESLSTRLAHVESAIEKAVETLNHQQQ